MNRVRSARFALSLTVLAGCGDPEVRDYGDPTALSLPTESAGITAWIVAPSGAIQNANPEVVVAAHTADDAETLEVTLSRLEANSRGELVEVGAQTASPSGSGRDQRFTARVGLVHGSNTLRARIATPGRTRVRTLTFSLSYEGAAPGVALGVSQPREDAQEDPCAGSVPLRGAVTRHRSVCAHGRVTSKQGENVAATLRVGGGESLAAPLAADGTFAVAVALPEDARSEIVLSADAGGQQSATSLVVVQDQTPPTITLDSTATQTTAPSMLITGLAKDPGGIVELAIESELGYAELPASGATEQSFERGMRLAVGDNPLTLIAVDGAGNEARQEMVLVRDRVLNLGAPRVNEDTIELEVDREALEELLDEDDQRDLEVVALDLKPAVRQALGRIRDPELYGVDTSEWGAPERNLQRILRMTPDVADLSGTSVEELLTIASGVGLPAPRMLAELLDMAPTDYIVDLDVAVGVIVDKLVGSHPNIAQDAEGRPVLAINMFDVLQQLATVGPRFGPVDDHPGFLTGESRGDVLESGFLLTFPVSSNLTQYDAIDLSRRSKDYLFLLEGDQVLDFNVLTDDFSVVGLVNEPTIDLRFALGEDPAVPVAGDQRDVAPDPDDDGFFRGNGDGFDLPPYVFEHITAEIGYRQLHRAFEEDGFQRVNRYDAGSIQDAAVIEWDHGWVTIRSAGGLGTPPAPLYAWDLLMEVAHLRVHDDGVAQGEADMAFSLERLPIGLTGEELVERLRPKLHEQEAKLSELLVGEQALASTRADVFYEPVQGGKGVLLFRAEGDGNAVEYPVRGFFSDPDLTQKVSTTEAAHGSEDTVHEKVPATDGATYYAADEDGSAYEIRVSAGAPEGIFVEVVPAAGGSR